MKSESLRLSRLLCLVFSLLFLAGTTIGQDTSNESSIFAYTDEDCVQRPRPRQPGTPDGACHKIATANASSLTIAFLGHGCTISAYSDENCTEDPTAIRENQCTSIGAFFLSFSVDNCTPNPPTTISTRIRTLSTSSATRSTGTNSNPTSPGGIDSDPPLSSSSTTSTPQPSSGLSSGAKAGIAVGITIAVLIIAALIIRHMFFRKRPSTPPVAPDHTATDPTDPEKKRIFWPFARRKPSHMFPPPPAELGGSYPDHETAQSQRLMQPTTVYELSAAHYGELPVAGGSADEAK
ncbi:hypothetical protein TWF970_002866 [Orbilia oligospora]|uniref:Mid2 domain-containing protein n=1 Tax=Orbilia oligospora TaxID=2813651 RepID=A0A7C8VQ00_ORBOL|nr:hypothetical protein TWF970_002866 [Orbilia oligospora]